MAIALGLAAAISWGCADFLGGLKSRTLQLLTVLAVSQGVGLVAISAIVLARGEGAPGGEEVLLAALSGVSGVVGLSAFYRGLAVGAMTVVAPLASMSAVLPVLVGLASGERPGALQGAGIVLALAGVVLAAREEAEAGRDTRIAAGVGLALLAALGFGGFFVFMDAASDTDVYFATFVNRITSLAILLSAAAVVRPGVGIGPRDGAALVLVGLLDISANVLFAIASTKGLVSVVGVLASLYPVVTILLARAVLSERVRVSQGVGVAGVLAGVALISAG